MNLYFASESRDTLKWITLFITVKTNAILTTEHNDKFEIKILKIRRSGHVFQTAQNFGHFMLLH